MSNVALVIAGGVGARMGQEIPKQFINVCDKPILIYTLEGFQRHPEIDSIAVVCLEGWRDVLEAYSRQYGITKLDEIVKGGSSGQESIRNGVFSLEGRLADDDIVIIHDGIRPLVDSSVVSDVLSVCRRYGAAVTSLPYNEQIHVIDEGDPTTTRMFIPRDSLRRVSTPQAYRFGLLLRSYKRAFKDGIGIGPSHYTNTMMVELGETLHFAIGSDKNIKLTTPGDLDIFRAYLRMESSDRG